MEGYHKPFHTPTNSSKGGTALYVNNNFDVFERSDLKIQNEIMEAVWVEIKNKNSKNIICGCIYRHPRSLKIDFDHYKSPRRHNFLVLQNINDSFSESKVKSTANRIILI